ncbi:MAG: NifB/NifX family molybdenum-iron cluster-binding protein [Gammaproteobacteria bacterium]
MKIGVTSQNFRTITGHAGKARRFIIFAADAGSGEVTEVERLDLPKGMDMHSFTGVMHPIEQLDVLLTGGCGNGFLSRMAAHGVQVITTSETDPIKAAKAVLNGESLPAPEPHSHDNHVTISDLQP